MPYKEDLHPDNPERDFDFNSLTPEMLEELRKILQQQEKEAAPMPEVPSPYFDNRDMSPDPRVKEWERFKELQGGTKGAITEDEYGQFNKRGPTPGLDGDALKLLMEMQRRTKGALSDDEFEEFEK